MISKKLSPSIQQDSLLKIFGNEVIKIDPFLGNYMISAKRGGMWKAGYADGKWQLLKAYGEEEGLTNHSFIETASNQDGQFAVQTRGGIFLYNKVHDRFFLVGSNQEINQKTTYAITFLNGKLYTLGYKNLYLDLQRYTPDTSKPSIYIHETVVNGDASYRRSQLPLSLTYRENNIAIDYSVINYTHPSNTALRYRLNDKLDWKNLPIAGQQLSLPALAQGSYTISLSASKANGFWSEPVKTSFIIHPPYWKELWFLSLIGVLITLLFYSLYQYKLRQERKMAEMQVKLAEIEGESLRAQMNPHFVFNALNSIKSYIIKNNKEEAADYLTTFSELIRAVLRNSKEKAISLDQEIEALKLYLQIENLRLSKQFTYTIKMDKSIDPKFVSIPPLIIQPFIENSIWHGFVHKKEEGHIDLIIEKKADKLEIKIIDNGVGRMKSKEIEKNRERKRSYGISITKPA